MAEKTKAADEKKFKTAADTAVVAVVGGEKITKGEIMGILYDWMLPLTLDEYINYKIVQQALKKEGLKVTEADINAKIAEIKKNQVPPGETLEGLLQRMKWPMARFRAYLTTQIGVEKIADKRVTATESDYAEYVKAKHILVKTTSYGLSEEEKAKQEADAKAKIEKIAAEIKAGKKFEDAAKEYSDDPGTKDKGGELGWFRKGEMVPEFTDAAFKLNPGEMSEPVKTFYGYHLILVEQVGKNATGADKSDLTKMIKERKRGPIMRQVMEDIRKAANVTNYVSPTLQEPKSPLMPSGAGAGGSRQ